MKSLNTLRDIPTSERARLLTRLTAYFLPNPLADPSVLGLPTMGPEAEVLEEILAKLQLDRDSLTSIDRPSILEELYKQFMANVLTDERSEAARRRLGMSGDVAPTSTALNTTSPSPCLKLSELDVLTSRRQSEPQMPWSIYFPNVSRVMKHRLFLFSLKES